MIHPTTIRSSCVNSMRINNLNDGQFLTMKKSSLCHPRPAKFPWCTVCTRRKHHRHQDTTTISWILHHCWSRPTAVCHCRHRWTITMRIAVFESQEYGSGEEEWTEVLWLESPHFFKAMAMSDGWSRGCWLMMKPWHFVKADEDKWLMLEFVRVGYEKEDLLRLNRVRIFQQVLFLSDILGAEVKSLDYQYLKCRPKYEKWSSLWFPKEALPQKDFKLWNEAIRQNVPAGGIWDRLQEFKSKGHKIYN